MKIGVIIPAAGAGKRFRSPRRGTHESRLKSLALLGGKPIFRWALEPFLEVPDVREVVVAVPRGAKPLFRRSLADLAGWAKKVRLAHGGPTRSHSVFHAIKLLSRQITHVLVHDGARPLVSRRDVKRILKRLGRWEGVVLARRSIPTLKEVDGHGSIKRTIERGRIWEAETPQFFKRGAIERAFRAIRGTFPARVTDCASLVEHAGGRVKVCEAVEINPKITTVADLMNAEAQVGVLVRTGLGWDVHRLSPGRPLWVGSVRVPCERGAVGHSDGDVLLHALIDALLGAASAGDIGDLFPDTLRKTRGLASCKMLSAACRELARRGWEPAHADAVVILERPRLAPYKLRIRRAISKLLGLAIDAVSVKAKTAEGLGAVGAGDAIEAHVVAAVRRRR